MANEWRWPSVDNRNRVSLALVEVGNWDLSRVFDHGCWRIESYVISEAVAWLACWSLAWGIKADVNSFGCYLLLSGLLH